jgi:transketolase
MNIDSLTDLALRIRIRVLKMSYESGQSTHLGGGLSLVDLLAYLYGHELKYRINQTDWVDRDRFILSKGHGVLGFFATLREVGLISEEDASSFMQNESEFIAHPIMNLDNAIESSNGSLGHGLSLGIGLAWAATFKGLKHRVFVLMGDGECNEGSVWEAAMNASELKLKNLVAIVDANGFQSDGPIIQASNYENLNSKWSSFGWSVLKVDGNSLEEIDKAFSAISYSEGPTLILARTIKGKGVDFMEDNNQWHHSRLTKTHYESALLSLKETK